MRSPRSQRVIAAGRALRPNIRRWSPRGRAPPSAWTRGRRTGRCTGPQIVETVEGLIRLALTWIVAGVIELARSAGRAVGVVIGQVVSISTTIAQSACW
jgi:hypothetical protein